MRKPRTHFNPFRFFWEVSTIHQTDITIYMYNQIIPGNLESLFAKIKQLLYISLLVTKMMIISKQTNSLVMILRDIIIQTYYYFYQAQKTPTDLKKDIYFLIERQNGNRRKRKFIQSVGSLS